MCTKDACCTEVAGSANSRNIQARKVFLVGFRSKLGQIGGEIDSRTGERAREIAPQAGRFQPDQVQRQAACSFAHVCNCSQDILDPIRVVGLVEDRERPLASLAWRLRRPGLKWVDRQDGARRDPECP